VGGPTWSYDTNNTRYDWLFFGPGSPTLYLRAFLDLDKTGDLSDCDPYINMGSFNPSTAANINITFDATNRWGSCGTYLTGTANYSPGGVSASHPIRVRLYDNPDCNYDDIANCTVNSNGGTYFLSIPSNGTYYATLEYVAGNDPDSSGYGVGSYMQYYDANCSTPADGIVVTGATTQNLSFNNSWSQILGYTGTLNYTGPGPVDDNHRASIQITDAPGSINSMGSDSNSENGELYNINWNGSSVYLRAFIDLNDNWQLDNGEVYDVYGPYSPNNGSSPYNISFSGSNTWSGGGGISPTPTPTGGTTGNFVKIDYTYTGPALSPANNLTIFTGNFILPGPAPTVQYGDEKLITSSASGTVTAANIPNGTDGTNVGVMAYRNNVGDGPTAEFHVGDNFDMYVTVCSGGAMTGLNTIGGVTISLGFDTSLSCLVYGLNNSVSYSSGGVDDSHRLIVQMSTNGPSYSNFNGSVLPDSSRNQNNPDSYELLDYQNMQTVSGPFYVRAFFDANGNETLDAGEPCSQAGSTYMSSTSRGNGPAFSFSSSDRCGN
jgi:hypothetical protein